MRVATDPRGPENAGWQVSKNTAAELMRELWCALLLGLGSQVS